MTSKKAAITIVVWSVLFLVSSVFAPIHPFLAGVAVGSALTAIMLLLTVKWSIEGMLTDTADTVEEIQDTLSDTQTDFTPDERE